MDSGGGRDLRFDTDFPGDLNDMEGGAFGAAFALWTRWMENAGIFMTNVVDCIQTKDRELVAVAMEGLAESRNRVEGDMKILTAAEMAAAIGERWRSLGFRWRA